MADSKRDRILFKICKALVTLRGDDGIRESFGHIGTALKCDGVFLLRSGDVPFLFEMKDLWEPKKRIAGKRLLLDYTSSPDWDTVNPYSQDEEDRYKAIDDTKNWECNSVTREFIDDLELGSIFIYVLHETSESYGAIVAFFKEPHAWSEDETALIKEAAAYILRELVAIKQEEIKDYLIGESDKIIKDANDSKNQFINNISHEIRTPVNALVGMVSIMRHNLTVPDTISECVDRTEKITKQLMEIINDCVDMSLINSNEMKLNLNWVPIETLLSSVKKFIDPLAEGRRQNFSIEYDPELSIYGDEAKMGRVLINALTNSCRNAEEGTNIQLTIKGETYAVGKSGITFRIHDEVAGLDADVAKHIFEPFGGERFHDMFKGSGLGMTVTKYLVDLMLGTIDFFSDGWGTELVIALPFETKGGTKEEAAQSDIHSEVAEMYIGRRVLIAEDNVLMGEVLATILGYRGLEADIVLNGQEALDKYTANDPFFYDLVLMDIQMPVMDGLEASRQIRASGRADSKVIPIVAVSANGFEEDIEKANAAGMNSYLNKPVGEKELLETISTYVL